VNILVITTRNLYENSGEYNLMAAKDKVLKSKNINLLYYSFRRSFLQPKPENLNILKQESTYSILLNRKKIIANIVAFIKNYDVKIIVLSGGWIFILHKELANIKREYGISFSFDYQGAIEEIVEYKVVKNSIVLSYILYKTLRYYENIVINMSDGVEVVSQNCLQHIKKIYRTDTRQEGVVVSCGIEYPVKESKYKEYRSYWRDKYNIATDDIACVYAGGIAKWQNVDEIIEKCKNQSAIKLYIFTSLKNQELIKKKYDLSSNIYFDYLSHAELSEALCAFDYGFLLRNEDITNYVAFPNKYSDYINARLQVVVKNKKIGYYPVEEERESLIQNISKPLKKSKIKQDDIYNRYIEDLSYTSMVKNLVKYYQKLSKEK